MPTKKKQKKLKAIDLVDQFSSLNSQVKELVFPDHRNGIISKPDFSKWGKIRQFLYQVAHSALFSNQQTGWQIAAYIILSYSALIQLALSLFFLDPKYYSIPNVTNPPSTVSPVVIGIVIITSIFVLPISLYWWHEIITDKRYSIWHKIAIGILFLLSLYALTNKIGLKTNPADWINPHSHLIGVFVILIFPAVSFLLSIGIDLILSGYYLLKVSIGGIDSLHNPSPFKEIKTLLQKDISYQEENKTWRVIDLSKKELSDLHHWATANREATEKRVLPLSIGLGILGFITFSETITEIIDKFVEWFLGTLTVFIKAPFSLPLQTIFLNISILLILLVFTGSITRSLLRLFVNISVQNVIIETCIVAIHGKENGKQKS